MQSDKKLVPKRLDVLGNVAQVVTAANIIGTGNGLEVGRRLELLSIRGAEAEAEQAIRLSNAPASTSGMHSPLQAAALQVTWLALCWSLALQDKLSLPLRPLWCASPLLPNM